MAFSRGKCCCCIPYPEPPRPQNPLDFTGGKVLGFVNYDPDRPEAGPFITTFSGQNIYPNRKEAKDGWGYVWTDVDLAAMNQQEPLPCIDLLNFFPPEVAERFRRNSRRNSNGKRRSPDRHCVQVFSPKPMPYLPYAPGASNRGFVPGPYPTQDELCLIEEHAEQGVEIQNLKDEEDNMSVREIEEFKKGFYRDRKVTEAIAKSTHPVVPEFMPPPVLCEEPFRPDGRPQVVRQCEEYCTGICPGSESPGIRVDIPRGEELLECEEGEMEFYAIRQCDEFCTGIKGGGQMQPEKQNDPRTGNLLQNLEESGPSRKSRSTSVKDSAQRRSGGVTQGLQTSPSLKVYFPPVNRTLQCEPPKRQYDECLRQNEAIRNNCYPWNQSPFYPNTYVAYNNNSLKSNERRKRKVIEESSSDSSDDSDSRQRPWYFQGLRYPAKKIRF